MEVPAMVFQGLLMRKERSFYCTRKIASGDDLVRLVVSNDLFPLTALFGMQKKMRDFFLRELSLVFFNLHHFIQHHASYARLTEESAADVLRDLIPRLGRLREMR